MKKTGNSHVFTNPGYNSKKVAAHFMGFEVVEPFGIAEVPAEALLEVIQGCVVCLERTHDVYIGVQRPKKPGSPNAKSSEWGSSMGSSEEEDPFHPAFELGQVNQSLTESVAFTFCEIGRTCLITSPP
jgi:hypothetical protein